jgi:hypothetical protein
MPTQPLAPAANLASAVQQPSFQVPVQQQQLYQMQIPQQYAVNFQQQPFYQPPMGYVQQQQQPPVFSYQPQATSMQQQQGMAPGMQPIAFNTGPDQQQQGTAPGMQPIAFNTGPEFKPSGGSAATARTRKPKSGKGGRPKFQQGVQPPSVATAASAMSAQGQQGAPALVPANAVTAPQGQLVLMQNQPSIPVQSTGSAGVPLVTKKLWCTKCQSAGHTAEVCETQQYCFICNKSNHPMTLRRCPALKMPKPAAMLYGYGMDNMAFFQMPDNVCREDLAPQMSPMALVMISGGSITSSIVEAEVAKIAQYQHQWTWEAIPHGQNAFLMSFPSDEVLMRVTGFIVFIKSHNVTLEFKAWKSEDIPHRFELIPIWVHVHGVPHVLRHFLGLWAVGSVIGATLDVDLLCLRRRGIVRIQVGVLNLDAFKTSSINSLSSDVVVQRKGYEFRYSLEESDFRVDADFVPRVWEHEDDPESDKGHDREDSMRDNDTSKRSKASSSATTTPAANTGRGAVPMQLASASTALPKPSAPGKLIAVTPPNPHRRTPPLPGSLTTQRVPTMGAMPTSPPSQALPSVRIRCGEAPPSPEVGVSSEGAAVDASSLPSSGQQSPSRRGVIFSPAVRADREAAMVELRALSSAPSSPGGASGTGATTAVEGEVQPMRSSTSSSDSSTPPFLGSEIPAEVEATPTPLRRSGRHSVSADGASATDEDSMMKAMRRTASRNLDFEGTSTRKSFLSFDNAKVSSNIASLGISLGRNDKAVDFSVKALKQVEFDRLTVAPKSSLFMDPLVSDEEEEESDVNHEGKLLSHLIKDTSEVDLEDTARDTMLCELVASVRKNKSNSANKKGRPSKKAKTSKQKKGSS